jgi:VIT1/CCC1 family predicted Fe2+/Mn2+ transporter
LARRTDTATGRIGWLRAAVLGANDGILSTSSLVLGVAATRANHRNEVQQLYNVSDRLDLLAEQHPAVSEALITIAGSVRSTATLLEVVVATKMSPLSGLDPANA